MTKYIVTLEVDVDLYNYDPPTEWDWSSLLDLPDVKLLRSIQAIRSACHSIDVTTDEYKEVLAVASRTGLL